jgi:hypothetical protein
VSQITLSRSNATYALPLSARVKFTSLDGEDLFFTWSPLENIREVNVIYLDCERAVNETGSFNIVIADPDNLIAKDHLRNARVTIEFGKTLASLQPYFVGYADIFTIRRPRSYYQEYLLTGPSTKIQAAELMLLIRQAADDPLNPNYGIGNLVVDSLTKRKWRVLNKEDIQEITEAQGGRWNVALVSNGGGVADELNKIIYSKIVEVLTTEWDFLERMSAITGAPWDLDYGANFEEIFTMKYPSGRGTGVTIKSSDLASITDHPERTSYIWGDFSIEDNSSTDAGVATRLYTTTIIDEQVISSQNTNAGSASLVDVARAQQIVIENDQRRITDLLFILTKVGDPKSPNDRINGDLVMDGGDNTPTGRTLATFHIPLDDIKSTPTNIFVNDIDTKIRFLQGENKVWLRLFQRSGIKGNPDGDAVNTCLWHHNGIVNQIQPVYTAFSTGPTKGDYKLRDTMTWSSANQGPIFCYSIFSNIRRLQARSNPSQAKKLRVKEAFTDTSFINQVNENNIFLSKDLARKSKSRRSISSMLVTIPNNFLFKPYQVVSFSDNLSNEFQDMTVQRARYVISALPGEGSPLGALNCELTLGGSHNSLIGSCSCM